MKTLRSGKKVVNTSIMSGAFCPRSGRAGFHPIAVTALSYLREAVRLENYESMREMVVIAREFGAGDCQIREVLS